MIECADCGWKSRYNYGRGKPVYFCGQYSTDSKKCSRNAIKEKELNDHLMHHYKLHNRELQLNNTFLKQEIEYIKYSTSKGLTIKFKNGLPNIIIRDNFISYVNMDA